MVEIQYIDRRKCRRVVPMKVLCLGASRTGTESMRRALQELGYNETYHGFAAAFETPRDCEMWLDACNAKFKGKGKPFGRAEWDQLLGHCQAVTDAPAMHFAEKLIEAYPEAKVILTIRDVDSWYRSFVEAIIVPCYSLSGKIVGFMSWAARSPFRFANPVFKILVEDYWRVNPRGPDGKIDPSAAKDIFRQHNQLVRKLVSKERLLEFSVQEGWEPLCKFLGKEVPNTDFPHGNEKADLQERINAFGKAQGKIFGTRILQTLVVVMAVWGIRRWLAS